MQCVLLCSLYIICLFLVGHAIGLGVPSMNPQHCESGAPCLCITWEKKTRIEKKYTPSSLSGIRSGSRAIQFLGENHGAN